MLKRKLRGVCKVLKTVAEQIMSVFARLQANIIFIVVCVVRGRNCDGKNGIRISRLG